MIGLAAIGGIVKTALGVVKVVDSSQTAQKVMEGIDHLNLTDEERAKYFLELQRLENDQNSERSKARRALALLWIRYQLSLSSIYLVIAGAGLRYPILDSLADKVWQVCQLYWWGTTAVISFFFFAHIARQFKGKK